MDQEIIRSRNTNLLYDFHDLRDSPAKANALNGLQRPFRVVDCEETHGVEACYTFAIQAGDATWKVQISEGHRPTCWCQSNGIGCEHIFWLVDQLMRTGEQAWGRIPYNIRLLADGSVAHYQSLFRHIKALTHPTIQQILGWNIRVRPRTDDGNAGDGVEAEELTVRISERLKWVIKPSQMIEDQFKAFNRDDEGLLENVFQRFISLIEHYNDNRFRRELDQILTPAFSITTRLVQKMLDYQETFRKFDAAGDPFSLDAINVEECTRQLRKHASDIMNIRSSMNSQSRYMWVVVGLLMGMLRGVFERNFNVYGNASGHMEADSADNNLYVHLVIESPGPHLILEELLDLASSASHVFRSHKAYLDLIEDSLRRDGRNPDYLRGLQQLITQIE